MPLPDMVSDRFSPKRPFRSLKIQENEGQETATTGHCRRPAQRLVRHQLSQSDTRAAATGIMTSRSSSPDAKWKRTKIRPDFFGVNSP